MKNFAPDESWDSKESRMQRLVSFMQFRHYLSLARQYEDKDLAERITATMHFHIRLTNMVRRQDPTSQHFLSHYAKFYKGPDDLPDIILNIVWLRNTMSRDMVKLCELGKCLGCALSTGA